MKFFKIAIFQWAHLMTDLNQCLIRAGPLSLVYLASLIFIVLTTKEREVH